MPEFRSAGVQECRSARVRSSGVQECNSAVGQECRKAGVQEQDCRNSGG
jgi:hypothetical protein